MNAETNVKTTEKRWRPTAAFYHPNGKGTGSALKLELQPAVGQSEGCIMMRVANQLTVGNRQGPNPVFPRFDWENSIVVKLNFDDLCKILQVLRGECESIEDGKGLYHRSSKAKTRICFHHVVEVVSGYSLEIYRTVFEGEQEQRVHFMLNPAESLGICEAIAGSMSVICFGVPSTGEFAAEDRGERREEARNAAA